MTCFAVTPHPNAIGQLIAAVILGALAVYWLLPRPRGRAVALGTFAGLAAVIVLGLWIFRQFGEPGADAVSAGLFWLFAAGAVGFGAVFVTQSNPARGAIAFAFAVLSVCGLFLLLAAPFLMAATVIIYAGAIIVTFLFVLMLSHVDGPSGENDRTREPLLGSLGGFAFLGLVLFALHQAGGTVDAKETEYGLPARPMTFEERTRLLEAAESLKSAAQATTKAELEDAVRGIADKLTEVVGTNTTAAVKGPTTLPDRLAGLPDRRVAAIRIQALKVREATSKAFKFIDNEYLLKKVATVRDQTAVQTELEKLRTEVVLLAAHGELPARNVANIGYRLYSDHLFGVEMAGAILLVATIGAVLIAGRRGGA